MNFAVRKRGAWVLVAAVLLLATSNPLGAQSPGKVFNLNELTVQPKLKSENAAAQAISRNYPEYLRAVGGRVQLRFIVRRDGKVDPASIEVIVASANQLGEAAMKAIKQIEFQPGQVDGVPVNSMVVFPITFAAR